MQAEILKSEMTQISRTRAELKKQLEELEARESEIKNDPCYYDDNEETFACCGV